MNADQTSDDLVLHPFSRKGQSDWAQSLKRVARGQAILWHETPVAERLKILARVDQEMEKQTK